MDMKSVLATALTAAARVALVGAGGWLAQHGIMQSSGTESFVSIGTSIVLVLASAGWDMWTQYVQPVMIARLEVWKMKALDRAAALKNAGMPVPPPPTVDRIDAVTPSSVTPAIAAMAIQQAVPPPTAPSGR